MTNAETTDNMTIVFLILLIQFSFYIVITLKSYLSKRLSSIIFPIWFIFFKFLMVKRIDKSATSTITAKDAQLFT